jgi:hypothetical protein
VFGIPTDDWQHIEAPAAEAVADANAATTQLQLRKSLRAQLSRSIPFASSGPAHAEQVSGRWPGRHAMAADHRLPAR